jgi:5-methylcytosine-specific restriction endonuclease McrA
MPRDYKAEYVNYHSRPEQKKKRAMRNAARKKLIKEGLICKGDGMEVDHIIPLRLNGTNDRDNLRVVSIQENRSWRKGIRGGWNKKETITIVEECLDAEKN